MTKELVNFGNHKGEIRFVSSYNLKNSLDKFFHYLCEVSKKPFNVSFDNNVKTYIPPDEIIISELLFRSYDCLQYNCSRCCTKTRFWNIFTNDQYKKIDNKNKGQKIEVSVNNTPYNFFVEDHEEGYCEHLDKTKDLCSIHMHNPIHCALPLLKFKRIKNKVYITREMYGRNWNMQCPVKFTEFTKEGYDATMYVLNRVKNVCDELKIENHMDYILNKVKEKYMDNIRQTKLVN